MPYKGAFLIAVSGGHTRSVACAIGSEAQILGVVEGESLNMHTYPHQEVVFRFVRLLDELASTVGVRIDEFRRRATRIVLSMAGAGTVTDHRLIEHFLLHDTWAEPNTYIILDDTWAGLLAGTLSCTGVCAFAGTGASVYVSEKIGETIDFHDDTQLSIMSEVRFHGGKRKIDGWGPTIGDFGSGFQLATDMFRLFNRELDRGNPPELFREVLREDRDLRTIGNVQLWFDSLYIRYTDWRIRFAKLASVATSAADRGDPHAITLVKKAAYDMIESIVVAIEKFPQARTMPIVFQGGMFEFSKLYRDTVAEGAQKMTSGPVYLAMFRPIIGALVLAMADSPKIPDKSALGNLLGQIKDLSERDRALLIRSDGHAPQGMEVLNAV